MKVSFLIGEGDESRVWTATTFSNEIIECDECGTDQRVWHFSSTHPKEVHGVFFCLGCLTDPLGPQGMLITE